MPEGQIDKFQDVVNQNLQLQIQIKEELEKHQDNFIATRVFYQKMLDQLEMLDALLVLMEGRKKSQKPPTGD